MINKGGRPKKGEGEIFQTKVSLYPSERVQLQELRISWKQLSNTDTIRKAIKICLQQEKEKSKEKNN